MLLVTFCAGCASLPRNGETTAPIVITKFPPTLSPTITATSIPVILPTDVIVEADRRELSYEMTFDKHGYLWIAGREGIFVWSPNEDKQEFYPSQQFETEQSQQKCSVAAAIIRDGEFLWMATIPSDCAFTAITIDKNGLTWAGTEDGRIFSFDGTHWKNQSLPNYMVTISSIITASDNSIWAGAAYGGVLHYDGTDWKSYDHRDNAPLAGVTSMAIAPDGALWASSQCCMTRPYFFKFDGISWTHDIPKIDDKELKYVIGSSDGKLWFGASDGIYGYNFSDGTWAAYRFPNINTGNYRSTIGNDGKIWIGTENGEVFYFDKGNWVSLPNSVNNEIQSMAVGMDSRIWVCTKEGIILHFDGKAWKAYTEFVSAISSNP